MRNLYYLYLIIYKKIYDNISNKKIDWNFILKFTFVTLFPNLIEPYLKDSILNRAVESNLISYDFYNPRDFTTNKHKKVDDAMVGGGAGMLVDAMRDLKKTYPQNSFFVIDTHGGRLMKQEIFADHVVESKMEQGNQQLSFFSE